MVAGNALFVRNEHNQPLTRNGTRMAKDKKYRRLCAEVDAALADERTRGSALPLANDLVSCVEPIGVAITRTLPPR